MLLLLLSVVLLLLLLEEEEEEKKPGLVGNQAVPTAGLYLRKRSDTAHQATTGRWLVDFE
jgi:hypothetical protein